MLDASLKVVVIQQQSAGRRRRRRRRWKRQCKRQITFISVYVSEQDQYERTVYHLSRWKALIREMLFSYVSFLLSEDDDTKLTIQKIVVTRCSLSLSLPSSPSPLRFTPPPNILLPFPPPSPRLCISTHILFKPRVCIKECHICIL